MEQLLPLQPDQDKLLKGADISLYTFVLAAKFLYQSLGRFKKVNCRTWVQYCDWWYYYSAGRDDTIILQNLRTILWLMVLLFCRQRWYFLMFLLMTRVAFKSGSTFVLNAFRTIKLKLVEGVGEREEFLAIYCRIWCSESRTNKIMQYR